MNGSSKTCKVTEITDQLVSVTFNGVEENYNKLDVALIEYKNGRVELITAPVEDLVYNPNAELNLTNENKKEAFTKENFVSVNSLALNNADVAVFYEHTVKNKLIGLGVMGAYNFNLRTTLPNLYLSSVHNAKKNYDIGATLNIYPGKIAFTTTFYFGMLIKHTAFSFDKVIADTASIGGVKVTNINYSRTNGSMLATMVTMGTHTFLNETFYLRTLIGLGAFKLRGDFKTEFNNEQNGNSNRGNNSGNINYLPKMYLGINIGFNF